MAELLHINSVGVLGARSFAGKSLLTLLAGTSCQVSAFSRQPVPQDSANINWSRLPSDAPATVSDDESEITGWVCVAPIAVLPDYLPWMKSRGARRIVALSSTSRLTKTDSSDVAEQALAKRIADSEQKFVSWAEAHGIEWFILRPTLIYGLGLDKNICEIARFIRRFWFFPLFGKACGLRQPVHVQDVAQACVAALNGPISNRAYNLSGGEALTYREMVARVFKALGRPQRTLPVPLPAFRAAIALLRYLPRYRNWSSAMAERMNQDMVFDHTEAARDLSFEPKAFVLEAGDLPA